MTFNRFAAYADNGGMSFGKADRGGIPEGYDPPKRKTQPKVRNARNVGIDDEDGVIANLKRVTDPFAKMLDRQALAYQAQFGGSYEQAYTKIYCDPSNRAIVDQARFEHLAAGEDAISGTGLSTISIGKAAPADETEDYVDPGTAEYELHRLTVNRMKLEPNLSYQQSFTREYLSPENRSLKQRYDQESDARMRGFAGPVKPFPNYGNPGDVRGGGRIGHTVGREGSGGEDF
jgi:hypothetical protein